VQAFYAISGFYMAFVLNEKYLPGTYGLFFSNRFLRLFPVYVVTLVITLLVALLIPLPFITAWQSTQPIDAPSLTYLIGTQVVMFGQDAAMFLGLRDGGLIFAPDFHTDRHPVYELLAVGQAWTLGVELWFYLIAPFLVRRPLRVIVVFIFASIAVRLSLQALFGFSGDPWSYRFFPSELALFLVGVVGYHVYKRDDRASLQWLATVVVCVGAALLANRWNGATRVASVTMLMAMLFAIPFVARWSRTSKLDRLVGELSYPIYIGHGLLIYVADHFMQASAVRSVVILTSILLSSAGLYFWIERPVDRWRQSRLETSLPRRVTGPAVYSSR
jgi:peptidoglycan/LPS O-acetylase OafA/YrhL